MRCLAIDLGDRRVGLAVGETETGLARPLETVERSGEEDRLLFQRIREIVKEEQVGRLIVGDPLNMDGSRGERSEMSRAFCGRLKKALRQCEVILWDERLSSFEADERMEGAGIKKGQRRQWRDAYAAAVILEDYFCAGG